jgi:predicted transcriptional regulator
MGDLEEMEEVVNFQRYLDEKRCKEIELATAGITDEAEKTKVRNKIWGTHVREDLCTIYSTSPAAELHGTMKRLGYHKEEMLLYYAFLESTRGLVGLTKSWVAYYLTNN